MVRADRADVGLGQAIYMRHDVIVPMPAGAALMWV
jgi:hypothetical protein